MSKLREEDIERWITVNGNHIPILKGESEEDAIKRFTDFVDNANGKKKQEFDKSKYEHINPGFDMESKKAFDPRKYNCTKCALAFEENMRGGDVEALEREDFLHDSEAGDKTQRTHIVKALGKKGDEWDVGANKRELVIKRISDMMEDFGPDSRALLFLAHKDGKHVVNVLANNGNPIIVDAQQAKHGSVKDMLKHYVTKEASMIRIDDADIPDDWKKWAYKKRGK